jgi:hypothetical protein
MGMIRKTVSGVGEDLKLVKNGKQYPKTAIGGTVRDKFTGSNDTRPAGDAGPNQVLKSAPGYIDQGAEYIGDTSHSRSWTKPGNRGSLAGQAKVTSESVTGGMGGTFWKEPEGF